MTRMPGLPGVARASRIRFSSAGAIGKGRPRRSITRFLPLKSCPYCCTKATMLITPAARSCSPALRGRQLGHIPAARSNGDHRRSFPAASACERKPIRAFGWSKAGCREPRRRARLPAANGHGPARAWLASNRHVTISDCLKSPAYGCYCEPPTSYRISCARPLCEEIEAGSVMGPMMSSLPE
jgi:hypothetical protein